MKISAGLIMYRKNNGKMEILLVHPGGPFFKNKDNGCWNIPKGLVEKGENLFETAKREFMEETGFDVSETNFVELKPAKRSDKIVHAWAFESDCDPSKIKSNTCMIEWPPRSGKQMEIPEIDRGGFFTLEEARVKLYPYLLTLVDEMGKMIKV